MLLTKKEKKMVDILALLLNHGIKKSFPFSRLANSSQLKNRQLVTLLEQLNLDLKNAAIPLQLSINPDAVYLISDPPIKNYVFLLQSYYIRNSGVFRITEEIFLEKIDRMDEFAEKYFYSRSVAYRYRSLLIDILADFNLTFKIGSPKPIRGKERQIRLFYSYIFCWQALIFHLRMTIYLRKSFFQKQCES
ncbi:helix-turn-helix domain-containing protein [uncultured Enterococcus sp.]|uniref:helix-turn-helix domain-containing protein n=1 Tax=uncultured Enterococcus sp. TaxID=167972 RepID=UPI002AA708C2|nr:helix-turn-helix domain-containing protein [uncultured Enterococcus sp.]